MPSGVFRNPEERARKISEAKRGYKHTEEAKLKNRLAHLGVKKPPRSEEHRRKISENIKRLWASGVMKVCRGHSLETRKKLSLNHRGEKAHNWKGGVTPIYKQIRDSLEYRLWQTAVFERDNYTCIWCGQHGGILNADHIKPFALYPELRFAIDNGRTLCVDCHRKTDTWGGNSKRKWL